jgi:regulatory protein
MNLEAALALAYAYLSRRERTVREMREHLLRRGADEEVADAVRLELTEQGYLDDARFAHLFVQDKRDLAGWGAGRIHRALLDRGVDRELVDSALARDDGGAGSGELGRALALLVRRFPGSLSTPRDRERALGVLLRKGYSYELAIDALAEHARGTL